MRSSLEQVLDACISQLNSGQDLEAVLAAHPEQADELRPMLVAAALVCVDVPPPTRKLERKDAFLTAVAARRREVEITEGYVVELKAGVPVAELLARAGPELRPLIRAAWRMHATPAPLPSPERMAEGKARLVAMAQARRRAAHHASVPAMPARVRRWLPHRLAGTLAGVGAGMQPAPTRARRAWSGVMAAVATVLVLGLGAAGMRTAAASSLPGDSLYEVKELGRSAQLLFAYDPTERAQLQVRITGQRLSDLAQLARFGRQVPIGLVEEWLRAQSSVMADIHRLPPDQRDRLLAMLSAAVGDRAAVSGALRGAVTNPGEFDALLDMPDAVWNRTPAVTALPDTTLGTVVPPSAARRAEAAAAERATDDAPAVVRPQPRATSAQVVAPAAPVAVPPAPPTRPAAQFVQPGGDESRRHSSSDQKRPDPAVTEPAPVATETVTTSPPAYNQPIFEDPTDTPEPPAGDTPAAPPSGGQAEPSVPTP